jgi:hypothetical protein
MEQEIPIEEEAPDGQSYSGFSAPASRIEPTVAMRPLASQAATSGGSISARPREIENEWMT